MLACNETARCVNCHEHFQEFRPLIKEVIVSKNFKKELPEFNTSWILDCEHEYFTRLHKFEEKINHNYIFRAVFNKKHIVYVIDKDFRLLILRAFKNFKEYQKFLEDKKLIEKMIESF